MSIAEARTRAMEADPLPVDVPRTEAGMRQVSAGDLMRLYQWAASALWVHREAAERVRAEVARRIK
jgi:hypothetical protein